MMKGDEGGEKEERKKKHMVFGVCLIQVKKNVF